MDKKRFANSLLDWFAKNQRSLPWRKTKEPYFIWVSEIMLQQTRVKAVEPFFEKFISSFPTVQKLAEADEQELLKHWEGLGFYRRVLNMQKTATLISQNFSGAFPARLETLLTFPGIGPYTAAAICSIAFEQRYPVLDGNVMRVIARLFEVSENILELSTNKKLAACLDSIFPDCRFGDFNQALMELGSLLCTPQKPSCNACPLSYYCAAYKLQKQTEIPLRINKTKVKKLKRYHFIFQSGNTFFLSKRKQQGLLANFWEFPGIEAANLKQANAHFSKLLQFEPTKVKYLFSYQHVFSHRIWKVRVYHVHLPPKMEKLPFFTKTELQSIALPTAFKKMREYVLEKME